MTISITTEDQKLLLRLRKWLNKNAPSAKIVEQPDVNWTDASLDSETDALVKDSIARHQVGDSSHLSDISDIKKLFYDLQS